jgi:hypothetical protein
MLLLLVVLRCCRALADVLGVEQQAVRTEQCTAHIDTVMTTWRQV